MAERQWYHTSGSQQLGPIPESELKALLAAGQITPSTYVWSDGMADWRHAADVPALTSPQPAAPAGMQARSAPLPGAGFSPQQAPQQTAAVSPGAAFSVAFDAWSLLAWYMLAAIAGVIVFWTPFALTSFYRWLIAHIRVPLWPNLSFTGKVGDIWWVFVLIALCPWFSVLLARVQYVSLVVFLAQTFLSWMVLRWIIANLSSDGQPLSLNFAGNPALYVGWQLLLVLSFISIIGWAWVMTAMTRWICANVAGTPHVISFNASGFEMLWRLVATVLASLFIIPIPWVFFWYARWYVSQFAIAERA